MFLNVFCFYSWTVTWTQTRTWTARRTQTRTSPTTIVETLFYLNSYDRLSVFQVSLEMKLKNVRFITVNAFTVLFVYTYGQTLVFDNLVAAFDPPCISMNDCIFGHLDNASYVVTSRWTPKTTLSTLRYNTFCLCWKIK